MTARGKRRKVSPPRAAKELPPQAEWGLALFLTGVALFLHFTFFTHAGALWRDEVNTFEFARMPSLSSLYEFLQYDSFPLLSTLLLRGWMVLGGTADQGIRVFGLLVGALTLGALWWTCRLLGTTPLISMALVGLNAWVVRTADSIRPYGLGMALIVATVGCVWKAVETSRPKWFALAGLFAVLSVQTMYQNAFLLLAVCLAGAVVAFRGGRIRTAVGVLAVGLAAAVSLALYLPSIAAAQSWGILVRNPTSMTQLLDVLLQTLGGSLAAAWPWVGLTILLGIVGVHALRSRTTRSDLALFCATFALVAIATYLIALKASQLYPSPWYFAPLAVVVAPTLDAAASLAATTRTRKMARLALAIAIACTVAIPGWRLVKERWTNLDVVASELAKVASAEDTIVLNPFWLGITFQRYYRGAAKWVTIPPIEDVHIVRYDLVKRAMVSPDPTAPALQTIARTLQSGHRVWWVAGLPPGAEASMPPAPHPNTGWYSAPYLFAWGRQATNLLEARGTRAEVMEARTEGPVSNYENVSVTVVSGWR